ncbi:MAG: hypothetical protein ACRC7O_08150, partial [Fimbriiglobus sp.]
MLILEGHASPVYALAFSTRGDLAAAYRGGGVSCWDPMYAVVMSSGCGERETASCLDIDFDATGDRFAFTRGNGWWS